MFGKILVPLDGSTFAEAALPLATALSRRGGDDLELVTVHEPVPSFAYDEWESAAREWSESYLEDVADRIAEVSDVRAEIRVLSGRVANALVHLAEDEDVGLVVMATHGRGAFTRAWLGSVADTFVRHAPCPVLLVRPEENGDVDLAEEAGVDTVLVPLDGSELAEKIIAPATALGRATDASYVLTRIVAYPVEIASPYLPHTVRMNQEIVDEARAAARSYLERTAGPLREEGLRVETEVLVDSQAGHGILRAAEDFDVDVIAMATHGRGGVARAVLGSAADKVIRGAHRPILVYRPPHED